MTVLYAEQVLSEGQWLHSARIHLADGRVQRIDAEVPPAAGDERHSVIVPAQCNLHSHAFQRGMAGLAEARGPGADDFWSWREVMYRFALTMTPQQLQAVAALAYVEMLEAGFCRVGEFHYLHHDVQGRRFADCGEMAASIVAAAQDVGIGLTLLPVFYAHAGFGGSAPAAGQRRFTMSLDDYARLIDRCKVLVAGLPGAVLGVAPHSLRAVTPDELTRVVRLLPGQPVHIHIAEQVAEVADCQAWSGQRPVQWLLDHAPVDEHWCLVHATHVQDAEWGGIVARGAVVGLCPVTEANLGDGIFPAAAFSAAGGRYGVGTDSNVCISLVGELALLEYTQRLAHRARNVIGNGARSTGATLYQQALTGGAQALGATAGIAPGQAADLVSLSTQAPAMVERRGDALLDSWIFAAATPVVDCVWVAGVKQVEQGRHAQRDSVQHAYRLAMKELCS